METGYACAVPACRQGPAELAHITPWSKVKEHSFDNLIALCPNHHARYDRNEIDRKAMLQYKANLAVLNGRYSDLERRVLQAMADKNAAPGQGVVLPGGMEILMMHLVGDGIVKRQALADIEYAYDNFTITAHVLYVLTERGRRFIDRWLEANPLL